VLKALNDTFQINYQNDKYFTIWYGVYNRINRQLIYASAGHPPAVLVSGKSPSTTEIKLLKTPGMPVGMFPEAKYVDETYQIEKCSSLYIFSDGAYEITKSDGNLWSLDGFVQLLVSLQHSVDYQLDYILKYLINLNSKESFDDDLSILQIKFD
jgi:sigma-B regulation protein RsbU (phosphoserine phosphatase)